MLPRPLLYCAFPAPGLGRRLPLPSRSLNSSSPVPATHLEYCWGHHDATLVTFSFLATEPCSRWYGSPLARSPERLAAPAPNSARSHLSPEILGSIHFCGNSFISFAPSSSSSPPDADHLFPHPAGRAGLEMGLNDFLVIPLQR